MHYDYVLDLGQCSVETMMVDFCGCLDTIGGKLDLSTPHHDGLWSLELGKSCLG